MSKDLPPDNNDRHFGNGQGNSHRNNNKRAGCLFTIPAALPLLLINAVGSIRSNIRSSICSNIRRGSLGKSY